MSTPTTYLPHERAHHFRDRDGVLSYSKHEDDVMQVDIELSPQIGSDTISSVTYADSGVTTSSRSNTSTKITFNVTGIGYTEITVNLTNSRALDPFIVRFYERRGPKQRDYL